MKGILTDVHMGKAAKILLGKMQSKAWYEFWEHIGLGVFRFKDVGLKSSSTDEEIWHRCQDEELIFITKNRNENSADSLGNTIRKHNLATSLPVFTIGDLDRLRKNKAYGERVVEELFGCLLDIDRVRGAGRLFLPLKG